jgi:hypothetical protein
MEADGVYLFSGSVRRPNVTGRKPWKHAMHPFSKPIFYGE